MKTLETYQEILMTPIEKEAMVRLQSDISNVDGVTRVVLFGSRSRGDFDGDSDYDILVLMNHLLIGPTMPYSLTRARQFVEKMSEIIDTSNFLTK